MGKVDDRHSGGGRGRKRWLVRNLGIAWGCPFLISFNGEDACGHPICGQEREQNAAGKL